MKFRSLLALSCLGLVISGGLAQKKPLDPSVYDNWSTVRGTAFSRDGKWILYTIAPQVGDVKVQIRPTSSGKTFNLDRATTVQFSYDSKYVVATIVPPLAEVKKATKNKVAAADMPKNSLVILDLSTGNQAKIDAVTSFQLPEKGAGWLTYRPVVKTTADTGTGAGRVTGSAATRPARSGSGARSRSSSKGTSSSTGAPLVIRSLSTGKEERLENVGDAVFAKDGTVLAYTLISKDSKETGIYWQNLADLKTETVVTRVNKVLKIALSDQANALAYLVDASSPVKAKPVANASADEEGDADEPAPKKEAEGIKLFLFQPKDGKSTLVADDRSKGLPKGWIISENSPLTFSVKGQRIFFGTAPKPAEIKKDDTPDNEKVSLDIWNWKDKKIMPEQLIQAEAEQKRTYLAVALLSSKKVVQLETQDMPDVSVSRKGDGKYAIGSSDLPYLLQASWDADYHDYFVVNVETGETKPLVEENEDGIFFSPDANYLFGFDDKKAQYFVYDPVTLKRRDLPVPSILSDELEDRPTTPPAYGVAGWSTGDRNLIVYDANDIWSIDPTGKSAAISLTGKSGRLGLTRYRIVKTDLEADFIDLEKPLILSAFQTETKASGFSRLNLKETYPHPEKLIWEDKQFSSPVFAKTGGFVSYTRQDFVEFPDVWLAKADFTHAEKLSHVNPQQSQYNWGTAELVDWISADGQRLQGILIKPEDFSYGKKYPMVTYFYERMSDSLHSYHAPAPSASTINWTYFASNGYVVFIPDVTYKTGYPGESSLSAIVTGVLSIVNRGYVDSKRLGIQGHSWGGYEVAYLVTKTNLFKCAEAGAAVVNMFSAYDGIRYGQGILREGQYEHGQSRIGGTIWETPLRYLENSPLFGLDKVQTPLLLLQNDKDGAVPYTQGIEYFSALRRLRKPAWLVTYNGEDHNLIERKNRKDWSIRLSQFFDHYLKDAPMPVWMSQGIPATQKGKTLGLELDPEAKK